MVLIKQFLDCCWMAATVDLGTTWLSLCDIMRRIPIYEGYFLRL